MNDSKDVEMGSFMNFIKELLALIILIAPFSASAWNKVLSCNNGALVLDVQPGLYPEYQVVINDLGVADYFKSHDIYGRPLEDGRMIFPYLYPSISENQIYHSHGYGENYTLTVSGQEAVLRIIASSGSWGWTFDDCQNQ